MKMRKIYITILLRLKFDELDNGIKFYNLPEDFETEISEQIDSFKLYFNGEIMEIIKNQSDIYYN